MTVEQIAPGLWRWTAYHDEWREDVGCVYLEGADAVVLVDPLVPSDEPERFWRALDRDVGRQGVPVHVLVTVFWHTRSAGELAQRYGATVWAPSRARAAVARRAGVDVRTFRPGDPLPAGVEALPSGRGTEVAYWVPAHRTLVPGDVLLGAPDGGLRVCPASWLPEGRTQADVAAALRTALELPVERVLVSHGRPVLDDAAGALARALAI